jgi:hypothetical protein
MDLVAVVILFKAIGGAPILKQSIFKVRCSCFERAEERARALKGPRDERRDEPSGVLSFFADPEHGEVRQGGGVSVQAASLRQCGRRGHPL